MEYTTSLYASGLIQSGKKHISIVFWTDFDYQILTLMADKRITLRYNYNATWCDELWRHSNWLSKQSRPERDAVCLFPVPETAEILKIDSLRFVGGWLLHATDTLVRSADSCLRHALQQFVFTSAGHNLICGFPSRHSWTAYFLTVTYAQFVLYLVWQLLQSGYTRIK